MANPPKGEIVPNLCYGDGKPYDVGHDRALINTLNAFIDYKSATQAPSLWSEYPDDTSNTGDWWLLWMGPVFFGTEQLTATVTRELTLAPWFRSNAGGTTGYIRATLSRTLPILAPAASSSFTTDIRFTDAYSQATWSTSSSTWGVGADATLSLGVKDLFFGFAWLCIEKKATGQLRGFSKFHEGPRIVT
jgi:hypothetical protein